MLTHKNVRSRGKIPLTKYFQNFDVGDSVAIVRELSVQSAGFPSRMQGRTGKVVGKRGASFVVEVYDLDRKKTFIIKPVNLKRIEENVK